MDRVDDIPAENRVARKMAVFMPLSRKDLEVLEGLQSHRHEVPPQTDVIVEGEPYERVHILVDGWACRYKLLPDGRRQILNFVLPGDFFGLRANWYHTAEVSVSTLTDSVVCSFPPQKIIALYRRHPRLGAAIMWASSREEAMMAEHVVRLGRRTAYERVAHLLIELLKRLQLVGLAGNRSYELPLTQEVLADTLGLSIVHVNRTLRRLREDGLVSLESSRLVIADMARLEEVADFEPDYLAQSKAPAKTASTLSRMEGRGSPPRA